MRVALVISSLGMGGAERVISIMANHWAANGWEITLFTLDDGHEPPAYWLDPRVVRRPLGIAGQPRTVFAALSKTFRRVWVLRRAVSTRCPDAVICFIDQTNVLTLAALLGSRIPVIVSERVDPAVHRVGRIWECARRIAYRTAAAVVCQTDAAAGYFSQPVRRRTHVIPNPVPAPDTGASNKEDSDAPRHHLVVAMGRLTHQKGFDLLLAAWARISGRQPNWRLQIWGEGPDRPALERLVEQHGLQESVQLPGRAPTSDVIFRQADLFVLSSRFEGFPNVLTEAMSFGVPVISFDCPSGPRAIIRHGTDGILVPPLDDRALAEAMAWLMSDGEERKRLGSQASAIATRFGVERVMGMWEAVLRQTRKDAS